MLSVYSLIKPSKSGNCNMKVLIYYSCLVNVTTKELNNIHSKFLVNVPITIVEIREIINENNNCSIRINKFEKLKEKLTIIIISPYYKYV